MGAERNSSQSCARDSVCIQTEKVYDICKDKECLEDLRVYFCEADQALVNRATSVKFRKAEILWASSDVEALPFNRGYFSVDISFYFHVVLEVGSCLGKASYIDGLATYTKKVILFGSEGSAYVFTSNYVPGDTDTFEPRKTNLPKAVVETVDPIALSAKIVEVKCDNDHCCCDNDGDSDVSISASDIPESLLKCIGGNICTSNETQRIYVTIGLFVITRLQRSIQLLIPYYDYCLPQKDCVDTSDDDPCALFDKIQFPFDEFYPPKNDYDDDRCHPC